jgi:hypothetical protein
MTQRAVSLVKHRSLQLGDARPVAEYFDHPSGQRGEFRWDLEGDRIVHSIELAKMRWRELSQPDLQQNF